jgi:hypothetical protein
MADRDGRELIFRGKSGKEVDREESSDRYLHG